MNFTNRYTTTYNKITDQKHKEWMDEIEDYVYSKLELYLLDLPDEPYRMDYDDGITASTIAKRIVSDYMSYWKDENSIHITDSNNK